MADVFCPVMPGTSRMSEFFSEALEAERSTSVSLRLRRIGVALVSLITLAAVALVFLDIDRQLDQSRTTDSDNVTWTIAQVEVDLLKLQRAARAAMDDPADAASLDDLRLAYDIFFSRMLVVKRSSTLRSLALATQLEALVWASNGFFERHTPAIDGGDAALQAGLPTLSAEIDDMATEIRTEVVQSLQDVMDASDRDRNDLRRSLQFFAGASLGLLGVMLALLVVIVLQSRAQQRRAQQTARAVHNLRATIESSLDAVVIADAQGRMIDCNRAAEGLFGMLRGKVRGLRFSDIVRGEGSTDPLSQLHLKMHERDNWSEIRDGRIQLKAHRSDGSIVPIEAALAEARGAGGEPMFIAFLRDISDRLEREENLQNARNDALKGEEAKSRFLAVMSHEMRTPLNGLIAATELMQSSTALDQRQIWLSEIILSCGWAALDQVNNVLELTRLGSASGPSYPVTAFSPMQVLQDLVLQNEPNAAKRGNRLELIEPDRLIPSVEAPRQLFVRVLYNLIGNAIKFTDAGSVTIRAYCDPMADGRIRLKIDVEDTGIGIADHDLERIFHNFQTLDDSYARMREGTGLGLGIAKLSAEALGGEIRVDSTLGKGSTFSFKVELTVADGMPQDQTLTTIPETKENALSILIAEDNPINSLLLTEMLKLRGHQVTVTVDGQEAVEQASAQRYDMILMDISMPRMDGLEATRGIRKGGACRDVPVVGVTANANPDRIPEFLAAGMTDVLVKPITRGALAAVLAAHGKGTGPAQTDAPSEQEEVMLNTEVFDETLEEMGRDFVERVAARMLEDAETSLNEVAAHIPGDLHTAGRVAHKAAGAAAAIGLGALHKALADCETAAIAGDAAGVTRAMEAARAAIPATIAALRARGLSVGSVTAG
jgi:PAS domain S-box-containing protein